MNNVSPSGLLFMEIKMNDIISKIVRNIWTLSTLTYSFLLQYGIFKLPEDELHRQVLAYNFIIITLYLYGNRSVKNLMPIIQAWLTRNKDKIK